MLHSKASVISAGTPLKEADRVLMMLHGRGANAADILSLAQYFDTTNTHLLAPQATNNTWYPYSFLAPVKDNEPWLSSAIELLKEMIGDILLAGKRLDQIFVLGFSQGASLTLEFTSRNAGKYGGIIAFTGGLIGQMLNHSLYSGDFAGTKVFIGNSDKDPHVPLSRSEESKEIMEKMGALVTLNIYKNMGHTINEDELAFVNEHLLN
jgi:phospholipase/carboxylesterase